MPFTAENRGASLIALGALIGCAVSIYNFFSPDSGINGTPGAILVIVSTLILFGFSLIMRTHGARGAGFRGFIAVSALLDIAGTAFAGYLLDSRALVILMAVCLAGWLMHVFTPRASMASRAPLAR